MTLPIALAGLLFGAWGVASDRIASVWPADEARRGGIGPRTVLLGLVAGATAAAIVAVSELPAWATLVHLALLVPLVLLTATDLEQRRLPHLALDPLIVGAVAFVPFNPGVAPLDAAIGAVAAVAFLGVLGLIIRGGVALGDLYLIAPLGLVLGWPAIFSAIFVAALLSGVTSLALLATRRVGMKSYIPFGPFLVAGAIIALLREPHLLGQVAALLP
jgi:leader peptidase (prepilin peptidase)/N-methyltransferase